jgi:hypothetical protein
MIIHFHFGNQRKNCGSAKKASSLLSLGVLVTKNPALGERIFSLDSGVIKVNAGVEFGVD